MDNQRTQALEKILVESQTWIDFAQSDAWQKLKARIETEVINPARDAFHSTQIDMLPDEKVMRGFLEQRTTVKLGLKIINLVEGEVMKNTQAKKELEDIQKHKAGASLQPKQGV